MQQKQLSVLRAGLLACSLLGLWHVASAQGVSTDNPGAPGELKKDDAFVLSPFVVTTDKDRGYAATNAISGSRLNTAIKDLPIPIQVITSEFISDIGATDLRSSLGYTSGIMLQTQNDLENSGGTYGSPYGNGGVNNPQGLTSNINQVQLKIRGFVTNNVLRDGFLRASSSDSVNIDRIEVVSGPNALLYGTGNFGGVVDYLTKQPLGKQQGSATFAVGTNSFLRSSFDVTGPVSTANHINYRLDASWESSETNIQYQKNSHYFIAPSFTWQPTKTTTLFVDTEYMKGKQNGYSFQALRAVQGGSATPINNDQIEAVSFYWPPGANHRTFNLSGPNTFNDQQSSNIEVKLTQEILKESEFVPGVDFFAGYNRSRDSFQVQNLNGQITGPILTGPGADVATTITTGVVANSIGGQGSNNLNLVFGTLPGSVVKYNWFQNDRDEVRDQERVELTVRKSLFAGKWYALEDQVLVGYSEILNKISKNNRATIPGAFSYKNPTDLTPIIFGKQGNGSADPAMFTNDLNNINKGWDAGRYINNYAKLFNQRIILMTGMRKDKNDNWSTDTQIGSVGATPSTTSSSALQSRSNSTQNGIIVKITKSLSVYGLKSQGIQPNFGGLHDAVTGFPVAADYAKSQEVGIKFDFMDGKLSGTISHYKITKTAFVQQPWYAPAPLGHIHFDPTKPIVYDVSGGFNANGLGTTPAFAGAGSQGAPVQNQPAVIAAWDAAVNAGAIYKVAGAGGLYINASTPTGAAYMDAAFAANQSFGGNQWPGWLFNGVGTDPNVNNATEDASGFINGPQQAAWQIVDQAKGWDGTILYTPNDSLQIVLTGSIDAKVNRLTLGNWAKYPYPQDRWAVWYFQNGSFGLDGQPLAVAYTNPADTSTRTNAGVFPGDDTPRYAADIFINYKLSGALKGMTVGLGGQWHSKEEYFSGVTHGGGQIQNNAAGKPIIAYSPSRMTVNLFAKYAFKRADHSQYVQLNVENLLDDTKIYGLIYSTPLTAKISYGFEF